MTAMSTTNSGIEIRPIVPDEFAAYCYVPATAFAENLTPAEIERWAIGYELDRSLAAFDGDRIVGTAGADSLELTLPGGATIPVGGLTAVAVLPTHRRRGILRALMERHFQDVEARGEAVSALLAAESIIYGRFGYGPATTAVELEIDPRRAAFLRPPAEHASERSNAVHGRPAEPAEHASERSNAVHGRPAEPAGSGRIRLVDGDEAAKLLPDFHDRHRRRQPGEVSRKPSWWTLYQADPESEREGFSRHYDAVYETEPGRLDGWVSYRVQHRWSDGALPSYLVKVRTLYALTGEAEAALFRYCLDLDLAGTVQFQDRPARDSLPWLLADPRRLRTMAAADYLWVRLLDLPAALTARRYAHRDALVIEVGDPLRPRNQGRFRLEGAPDGAACQPAGSATPDLALGIAELSAAYLGGVPLTTLARAGRVAELTPGALLRADAMFTSTPAPWCTTSF